VDELHFAHAEEAEEVADVRRLGVVRLAGASYIAIYAAARGEIPVGAVVIGPDGGIVSEGHFSDRFSPTREPAVLRLQPGEKFTANVALLATVPRGRRVPGKYTVQASYRFQGRRVTAQPLAVEVI